ncbi:hypothetical protein [Caldalkalibacillus mannanilyticus]|uniref:hypothetical protein n=1 Tax=Caldalkalibacillus mannanilyticus TaxID=1418 RepID=UPI00046A028F|nr:hypothetical protein [Caldalkalibacillus mannanilyticus]
MEYKRLNFDLTENESSLYIYRVRQTNSSSIVEFYDMDKHISLSYANGQVTARVYDYLGNPVPAFSDPIKFEFERQTVEATPSDGVATINFEAESGTYTVRTVNENIRNGEVTFDVES